MRFTIFFLALALQAQGLPFCAGGSHPSNEPCRPVSEVLNPEARCEATDWKVRAEWLEAKAAQLESKLNAVVQMYNADMALTGLAAKEPPKPAPAKSPVQGEK